MSVYSTIDITREDAEQIIRDKIASLSEMPGKRIISILEAIVQVSYYDDYFDFEYGFNNFYLITE